MTWLDPVRAALQAGDRSEALRLVVARLRQTPQDTTALLWFAALTRERAKAVAALRYVLQLEPDNIAARKALAALVGEGASPQAGPPPAGPGFPGERCVPQKKPLSQEEPRPASGEGGGTARGLRVAKDEATDEAAAEAQGGAQGGGEGPAVGAGELRIVGKGEGGERSASHSQAKGAAEGSPGGVRPASQPGGSQPLPPTARIRGGEVLRRAGEVIWPFRGHRRPLRTLLEVGLVEDRDLRWAVENAREGEIRWAAAVWLREAEVQDLNLTVAQAAETPFPFRRLNRPLGDLLREGRITLRDLAYALHRGYSPRLRQAAALLGYLVLEGLWPSGMPSSTEQGASPPPKGQSEVRPAARTPEPTPAPPVERPKPAPATEASAGALQVFRGSDYLHRQQETHERWVSLAFYGLRTLIVLVAVLSGGGGLWAILALHQRALGSAMLGGGLLALLLIGKALPWYERLRAQRDAYRQGVAGEQRLVNLLRHRLDARWALYRNLELPDRQGDLDAVLVGPRGVYLLEVKAYRGAHRYRGNEWYRRRWGRWVEIDANPSQQAVRNALRLADFLREHGTEVWVEPRVVWAGPGRVWIDGRPDVPLWDLNRPGWIWRDLGRGRALSVELRQRIHRALAPLLSPSREENDV